jgi:monoamine oxidase
MRLPFTLALPFLFQVMTAESSAGLRPVCDGPNSPSIDATEVTTVIVVGAGTAGISAAALLQEAGVNHIILESTGRIGGRVRKTKFGNGGPVGDGWIIEDGANWLDFHQTASAIWVLAQQNNFQMAYQNWNDYYTSAYDENVRLY